MDSNFHTAGAWSHKRRRRRELYVWHTPKKISYAYSFYVSCEIWHLVSIDNVEKAFGCSMQLFASLTCPVKSIIWQWVFLETFYEDFPKHKLCRISVCMNDHRALLASASLRSTNAAITTLLSFALSEYKTTSFSHLAAAENWFTSHTQEDVSRG